MGIRNDIQVEGSTAGFSVLVKSSGLLQNVLATLDIIIEKMVRHFKFVFKPNNVINFIHLILKYATLLGMKKNYYIDLNLRLSGTPPYSDVLPLALHYNISLELESR